MKDWNRGCVEGGGTGESWLAERSSYPERQVMSRVDPGKEKDGRGRPWELENEAEGLDIEGHWQIKVDGELILELWPKTALYILPV